MKTARNGWALKSMLVSTILFFTLGSLYAGTSGKIAGRVTNAVTGEPLFGANVIVDGTNLGASTDDEGDYYILRVPPGTYTVRASMIGFDIVAQTNVRVEVDHTVPLNYNLNSSVVEGEVVVVEAMREVIKMDISSSQTRVSAEDMLSVSTVSNMTDFLNLTSGVQDMSVRGGGLNQTGFMLDGLDMVDNRSNKPVMSINLSSVEEVSVIKGGFSAEYGNVRSGLISVVTKEGSNQSYHGSVDMRMAPAYQKHEGPSLIGQDNWWTRPYLDEDVAFEGTARGDWERDKVSQNQIFSGWDKISRTLLLDDNPNNDKTPEQCRDMFLWEHALEGSGELGQTELEYAHKPDWNGELSLSGPVPLIGRFLGDMSFFASTRKEFELFATPTLAVDTDWNPLNAFESMNTQVKLTSHLSNSMKLNVDLMFNSLESLLMESEGEVPTDDDFFDSGDKIVGGLEGWRNIPFSVERQMMGLTFDHVLSPSSYYSVKFSKLHIENLATPNLLPDRDLNEAVRFGSTGVDERPWGVMRPGANVQTLGDGMLYSTVGYGIEDSSQVTTYNVKIDYTNQVNKHNQIKTGVMVNIDQLKTKMRTDYGVMELGLAGNQRRSEHDPMRLGAYITDRLEFQGMIANLGVRMDYSNPNTDWYDLELYDAWLSKDFRDDFIEEAPRAAAEKGKVRFSPRFGMSHPISETSKIYFNYGHFYSMPMSSDMYRIGTFEQSQGITYLANPNIDPPRTVQYEVGFETSLMDMLLLSMVGYYKDVSKQTGQTQYIGINEVVNYATVNNNNYADTRGFEVTLEKRFGRWFNTWVNYNYMVETSGYFGFSEYYENPQDQDRMVDPNIERPIAQPFARGNFEFMTPIGFGPEIAGIEPVADWNMSWLVTWSAGDWITWNPLDIYGVQQNVQTKDFWGCDLRVSRIIDIGNTSMTLFADVVNVFNIRRLNLDSFSSEGPGSDYDKYMRSLKLDLYNEDKYKAQGYEGGTDKPGDFRPATFTEEDGWEFDTDERDYIDMPDIDSFWFMNPRHIWLGLRFQF